MAIGGKILGVRRDFLIVEYIDLTTKLNMIDFDIVMEALRSVVDESDSLALDNKEDREELKVRLLCAIGAVLP